jgi:hypothetical protein
LAYPPPSLPKQLACPFYTTKTVMLFYEAYCARRFQTSNAITVRAAIPTSHDHTAARRSAGANKGLGRFAFGVEFGAGVALNDADGVGVPCEAGVYSLPVWGVYSLPVPFAVCARGRFGFTIKPIFLDADDRGDFRGAGQPFLLPQSSPNCKA